MQYVGEENEAGGRFAWSTRVEVKTDAEAQIAGQQFARLCDQMGQGAVDWQAAMAADDPEL